MNFQMIERSLHDYIGSYESAVMAKGAAAKQHSLNSAQQYEVAYKETEGYYSGINSATMAFAFE